MFTMLRIGRRIVASVSVSFVMSVTSKSTTDQRFVRCGHAGLTGSSPFSLDNVKPSVRYGMSRKPVCAGTVRSYGVEPSNASFCAMVNEPHDGNQPDDGPLVYWNVASFSVRLPKFARASSPRTSVPPSTSKFHSCGVFRQPNGDSVFRLRISRVPSFLTVTVRVRVPATAPIAV